MPRTILLRRPPTVSLQETPFVPRVREASGNVPNVLDEVDRRWAAMCAKNPSLHDGRMCHVLGVHRNGHGGASIHVMDCAYRFYAVQDEALDLGVRHLGVKAITIHAGRVLMGRRSLHVRAYPGLWEFAPGGVIEPGREVVDVLRNEFAEETGLGMAAEPTPIALIFDSVIRCWEVVYRVNAVSDELRPLTDEYSELRWCERGALPEPMSPAARQMVEL